MREREPNFGVLGGLEITVRGEQLPLPAGRRRAVLAALLVERGHPVTVDSLVDAGWGDGPPADPPAALYTVISRLRGLIGGTVLRKVPGGYALFPGIGAVDADRFDRLCEQAARSPAAEAARLLDDALALWRGDPYAEFADRDFVLAESTRLAERRLAAIEDRSSLELDAGAAGQAVVRLRPLVDAHPYRERALGLLMTALFRAGRTPEALEAYHRYRQTLAGELGLEPSPYLFALHSRILGNDGTRNPERARAHPVDSGRAALRAATPLIGRIAETTRLVDLVSRHRLITVTGPGGVGKSRLVGEALEALEQRTRRTAVVVDLAGIGSPAPVDVAGSPVDPGPGAGRGTEEAVLAAVCLAAGLEPLTRPSLADLEELLSAGTQLVVLDNCEHLREAVGGLVGNLARGCPEAALVITSRVRMGLPGERVLAVGPLEVPRDAPLRGMPLQGALLLLVQRVRAQLSEFDPDDEWLADAVEMCRRLDGVPLTLELAARHTAILGMHTVLEHLGSGLDLTAGDSGRHHSLRRILEWSWALLPTRQQQLIESLSVFGGDIEPAAAGLLTGSNQAVADADLVELVESSLLAVPDDRRLGTRFRMMGTVHEYAAERLLASGRSNTVRAAHAAWAQRVAEEFAAPAGGMGAMPEYARLNRLRPEFSAAVRWSLEAGRTEAAGAITGALVLVPHWRPGPDLWGLCGTIARHPGLHGSPVESLALSAAAWAATETGEWADGRQLALRAQSLATTVPERFVSALALGVNALYAGRHGQAISCWELGLSIEGLAPGQRAELHSSLALAHCYAGRVGTATDAATAARMAADRAGIGAVSAFATYARGEVLAIGDTRLAVPVLRHAMQEGERLGADQVSLVARIALLAALAQLDEHHRALDLARSLVESQLHAANWPQLWTTLRTAARSFSAIGRHSLAEFLLAAAEAAPSAPRLVGPDAERHRLLRQRLVEQLGASTAERIAALAGSLPRAEIAQRAWAALAGQTGTSA